MLSTPTSANQSLGRLNKVEKKPCSPQRRGEYARNGGDQAKLENREMFASSLGEIEE